MLTRTNSRKGTFADTLLALFVLTCVALPAGASESVIGSKHDLAHLNQRTSVLASGIGTPHEGSAYTNYLETCVYCHVPHLSGSGVNGTLFNRVLPQDNYKPYSGPSGTMDATPNRPSGVSLVCLSCHDGTIAVDSIVNTPNTSWAPSANHQKMSPGSTPDECGMCHRPNGPAGAHDATVKYLTQDLRDDHPISISYLEALTATPREFRDPFSIAPLRLFNDRVECPTCHDVHNPQYFPFLRKPNDGSDLCLTCHIK